jgi:hypothetical protein
MKPPVTYFSNINANKFGNVVKMNFAIFKYKITV